MSDIEKNKELIKKYPFLLPRNVWTDKVLEDYDYSYTRLDEIPDGWRIAFGEQLCEELKDALLQAGYLDKFRFTQIKEKYGTLRLYNNGCNKEAWDVINKYEALSARTCIVCGKPATKISQGWICPYCDKCGDNLKVPETFVNIDEYFSNDETEC